MPSLVEIDPVILGKRALEFRQYIFVTFYYYLPLAKCIALYLKKKTLVAINQGCYVPSLVEIGPVVLEKKMKM